MQLQHRRTEEPVAESTGQTHGCYSTTADAQRTEEVPCSNKLTSSRTEQHSRTPPLLLHSRGGKEATKKNPGGQKQSRSSFTGSRWPRGRRSNGGRAARGQAATSGRRTTDGCCNRQQTGGERAPRQADPRWAAAKNEQRPRDPWTHDGGRPAAGGTMDLGGMR